MLGAEGVVVLVRVRVRVRVRVHDRKRRKEEEIDVAAAAADETAAEETARRALTCAGVGNGGNEDGKTDVVRDSLNAAAAAAAEDDRCHSRFRTRVYQVPERGVSDHRVPSLQKKEAAAIDDDEMHEMAMRTQHHEERHR